MNATTTLAGEIPGARWDGQRCTARRCTLIVADPGTSPQAWYRPFVGQRRRAVEVRVRGSDAAFYVDDETGDGEHKVRFGGSWTLPHASLDPLPGSVQYLAP
jgi:hypothetical protein